MFFCIEVFHLPLHLLIVAPKVFFTIKSIKYSKKGDYFFNWFADMNAWPWFIHTYILYLNRNSPNIVNAIPNIWAAALSRPLEVPSGSGYVISAANSNPSGRYPVIKNLGRKSILRFFFIIYKNFQLFPYLWRNCKMDP